MRGKGLICKGSVEKKRITPAYAGKSAIRGMRNPFNRDHPRLCGEKYVHGAAFRPLKGSPPPMRGKVRDVVRTRVLGGITPAYAGKSSQRHPVP